MIRHFIGGREMRIFRFSSSAFRTKDGTERGEIVSGEGADVAERGTMPGAGGRRTRPDELEDGLNLHLYHPLSHRLALALRHTPVSPNMVSVSSLASILAATAAYTLLPFPQSVAVGLACHILWHILDGADGDLARITGKTSPLGEIVDGICDYLGHIILYTALAFYAGGWAWVVTPLAAASRILQANHIESVRRTYLWRAYGVPWIGRTKAEATAIGGRRSVTAAIAGALARVYVAAGSLLNPRSHQADAAVEARGEAARPAARRIGREALFVQEWLGPNRRTLLLGLSMAAGTPLWFFLFECTVLNLLLIVSIRRQRAVNARLAAELGGSRAGAA
jgi:phosphatidylglycerophosphate synthase